jgi:hypothetical protein
VNSADAQILKAKFSDGIPPTTLIHLTWMMFLKRLGKDVLYGKLALTPGNFLGSTKHAGQW